MFIAVWNLHRSESLWDRPNEFDPSRWDRRFENDDVADWNGLDPSLSKGLYPNEIATDYAFLPFGAGTVPLVW